MKKIALFVEGHTEATFVRKLVGELAGVHNVAFIGEKYHGGTFLVDYSMPVAGEVLQVLIANCCNDSLVLSAIRDRYTGLVNAGYSFIMGVRDLYPLTLSELPLLESGMKKALPTGAVPTEMHIAVAEVEAWFIEEKTHFERVHSDLNEQAIHAGVGYDVSSGQAESIPHPAEMLHDIYKLVNLAYKKKKNQVSRTVEAIDYEVLRCDVVQRSQSFYGFVTALESHLFATV